VGGIGHDLDRAHRGEMVRDDGERQQQGRTKRAAHVDAANGQRQRDRAEHDAERHRSRDQTVNPLDAPGQLERGHSQIMHAGDAAADDGAAERRAPPIRPAGGNAKPRTGHRDGGDQRQHGQADVVGGGEARRVGQHGNEMGRPDAAAGRYAGDQDPHDLGAAVRYAGAMEQVDGREAGQKAQRTGEDDQPPVMLGRQAGEYAVHGSPNAGASAPCKAPGTRLSR
jgi:hypothetical protein